MNITPLVLTSFLALAALTTTTQAASFEVYNVNVADNDTLNLRSEPNGSILYGLPNEAQVLSNGTEKTLGANTWVQIHWNNFDGWVNKKYLTTNTSLQRLGTTTSRITNNLQCSGTEPFWNFKITPERVQGKSLATDTEYHGTILKRTATRDQKTTVIDAGRLAFLIQKTEACSDGMSDNTYPYAVDVLLPYQSFLSGCCR
ncbi:MAG: hypothetical protein RLZZ422_327 [Pseudomonadota bacterium]|jgi:uncharacterized membrane protein